MASKLLIGAIGIPIFGFLLKTTEPSPKTVPSGPSLLNTQHLLAEGKISAQQQASLRKSSTKSIDTPVLDVAHTIETPDVEAFDAGPTSVCPSLPIQTLVKEGRVSNQQLCSLRQSRSPSRDPFSVVSEPLACAPRFPPVTSAVPLPPPPGFIAQETPENARFETPVTALTAIQEETPRSPFVLTEISRPTIPEPVSYVAVPPPTVAVVLNPTLTLPPGIVSPTASVETPTSPFVFTEKSFPVVPEPVSSASVLPPTIAVILNPQTPAVNQENATLMPTKAVIRETTMTQTTSSAPTKAIVLPSAPAATTTPTKAIVQPPTFASYVPEPATIIPTLAQMPSTAYAAFSSMVWGVQEPTKSSQPAATISAPTKATIQSPTQPVVPQPTSPIIPTKAVIQPSGSQPSTTPITPTKAIILNQTADDLQQRSSPIAQTKFHTQKSTVVPSPVVPQQPPPQTPTFANVLPNPFSSFSNLMWGDANRPNDDRIEVQPTRNPFSGISNLVPQKQTFVDTFNGFSNFVSSAITPTFAEPLPFRAEPAPVVAVAPLTPTKAVIQNSSLAAPREVITMNSVAADSFASVPVPAPTRAIVIQPQVSDCAFPSEIIPTKAVVLNSVEEDPFAPVSVPAPTKAIVLQGDASDSFVSSEVIPTKAVVLSAMETEPFVSAPVPTPTKAVPLEPITNECFAVTIMPTKAVVMNSIETAPDTAVPALTPVKAIVQQTAAPASLDNISLLATKAVILGEPTMESEAPANLLEPIPLRPTLAVPLAP